MNKRQAIAFTGHRPESLPFGENEKSAGCARLKEMLRSEVVDRASQGYEIFYCGAARGSDILFGEQVLQVRNTAYPAIRLICVIPHENQAENWPESWRDRYFHLLEQANDEVLISTRYTRGCYHQRNRYMVDRANALLAVFNGTPKGGTAYTVEYARNRAKEIVIFDPGTLERILIPPSLMVL